MRALVLFITFLGLFAHPLTAEVKLPQLFSNNMVLQRDREIVVWGWANPKEKVSVQFKGQTVKAVASPSGDWKVALRASSYGGPFVLKVKGERNLIELENVMVGDVWLCSGQSNMEWPVESTANASQEIGAANHPGIRLFTVEKSMDNAERKDVEGSWSICSPETIPSFSAVGYFFGREIHTNMGIPIGLVDASWGGTVIETWTGIEMMQTLPQYQDAINECASSDFHNILAENEKKRSAFTSALKDDPGVAQKWQNDPAPFNQIMKVPGNWDNTALQNMDGSVWFRFEFELSGVDGKPGRLSLGAIDDQDITWINGVEVGRTNSYSERRVYDVLAGVLKEGKNTIVVNVVDYTGGGGLYSESDLLFVEVGGAKHSLAGDWQYAISVDSRQFGAKEIGPNAYPSLLFNAMIAPLTKFPIKGTIWYQGESNVGNPQLYQTLFPNLIKNWRSRWGYAFPFYWVNLANYMAPDKTPAESGWAELREAQSMTLALPKTGQALAIDIGDANDIHPRNKQDVGRRLALLALRNDYGKSVVCSGPVFDSAKTMDGKVIVSFKEVGSGLMTKDKYGYVKGFAIAGEDGQFVWAQAFIEGEQVFVFSPLVKTPRYVRYAWGNNPDDANLYNREGLPTTPFQTDLLSK